MFIAYVQTTSCPLRLLPVGGGGGGRPLSRRPFIHPALSIHCDYLGLRYLCRKVRFSNISDFSRIFLCHVHGQLTICNLQCYDHDILQYNTYLEWINNSTKLLQDCLKITTNCFSKRVPKCTKWHYSMSIFSKFPGGGPLPGMSLQPIQQHRHNWLLLGPLTSKSVPDASTQNSSKRVKSTVKSPFIDASFFWSSR